MELPSANLQKISCTIRVGAAGPGADTAQHTGGLVIDQTAGSKAADALGEAAVDLAGVAVGGDGQGCFVHRPPYRCGRGSQYVITCP